MILKNNKDNQKKTIFKALLLSTLIYLLIMAIMPIVSAEYSSISLNIYPLEIYTENFVTIYGYVGPVEGKQYVHMYVDTDYMGLVKVNQDGYYTKDIRMFDDGRHKITVRINNVEKYGYIQVIQAPPYTINTQRDCTICETTIIYDNTVIISDEPKEKEHKYVTVDVSTNEIDLNRYEGNTIIIKVTNNLGENEIFSIETDFDQNMLFLPHKEVIDDSKSKLFHIYFNPRDKEGRYYGTIYVKQDTTIIREIPITLFVAKNPIDNTNKNTMSGIYEIIGLLLLTIIFSAIIITTLMKNTRTSPKPLSLNHLNMVMTQPKSINATPKAIKKGNLYEKYFTTWNNVKY
ncbi:MAG: hypothetical protein K0B02_00235 [DPANN group archaeon]|nr:hypothetical protein [DPANN group archaeon]